MALAIARFCTGCSRCNRYHQHHKLKTTFRKSRHRMLCKLLNLGNATCVTLTYGILPSNTCRPGGTPPFGKMTPGQSMTAVLRLRYRDCRCFVWPGVEERDTTRDPKRALISEDFPKLGSPTTPIETHNGAPPTLPSPIPAKNGAALTTPSGR